MEKKKLSKKVWIPLLVVGIVIALFTIIFPIIYCCVIDVDLKIEAVQVEDTQKIDVFWNTDKSIDRITITVLHNGDVVNEISTAHVSDLVKGHKEIDAYYGKMTVKVKVSKGIYSTTKTTKVNLSADEYNIAPMNATMPVTLFTLSIDEITNNGTIPTFVWFERSGAWDWDSLPENVYAMPTLSEQEFMHSQFTKKIAHVYEKVTAWVKELHEVNPDSVFHFYYGDYYLHGLVDVIYGNNLPKDSYTATILTDGAGSFTFFNEHYNVANVDPVTEYNAMVKNWNKLKEQVANKKKFNLKSKYVIDVFDVRDYAFVIANEEENIDYWLSRNANAVLAPNHVDFYNEYVATNNAIKTKAISTLLNNIEKNKTEEDYLNAIMIKKLYKFSDTMFEKAEQNNKKIMAFMGTHTSTEKVTNFEEYVKATMAFYGDEYEYYYKGHPNNPTASVEGKLEYLESLGLTDVDSTIAAELLLFFNPEINCSGYDSSTYTYYAPYDNEKLCAVWGKSKTDTSYEPEYKQYIDVFMSMASTTEFGNIVTSNQCVLLEFQDTTNYDIAIFDAKNNTMTYYKNVSGSYQVVTVA